ncbi:MAG: ParB N-terminal domain-containing protein [Chitinophagaceae bacterium]|nr:ParB N-terminal domain-containing protein [Chitinophagaceae bacterium]
MKTGIVKISHLVEIPELKAYYTPQSIDEIATSIEVDGGMRSPIIVTENYEIIDGYRRVDAMKVLNKEYINVLIDDVPPTTFERIIRNMYREKSTEDKIKEIIAVFEKFPKKMGQKNKDNTVYNRSEKIASALNNKYSNKETIVNFEYIINNDINDWFLTKAIIERNWKVDPCYTFLKEKLKIDEENNYGITKGLLSGNLNINEANKLISERAVLDKKFDYTFVIPDKSIVFNDDCRKLPELLENKKIVDLVITSIPYWNLRTYNGIGNRQLGQEETKEEFAENIGKIFSDIEPILKDNASVVVNIGETYLDGQGQEIPFLVKDALRKHTNLYYKDCIIWSKKNSRPQGESVKRLQNSVEYLFWFVKDIKDYKYNLLTFPVEGKEAKITSVKDVNKNGSKAKKTKSITKPYGKLVSHLKEQEIENIITAAVGKDHELFKICSNGHPAPMSPMIPVTLTLMLSDENSSTICDPFGGSQVTGKIATLLNRRYVSAEISKEYFNIGCQRLLNADEEFDRDSLDVINELVYHEFEEAIAA